MWWLVRSTSVIWASAAFTVCVEVACTMIELSWLPPTP